jgi:hypothetical protein
MRTPGSVGGATRSYGWTCDDRSLGTSPGVRPPVPYQDVRPGQPGGAKLLGQRNLTPWGDRVSREGIRRLPASRRSGARVDGMANSGELLINVVRSNKPKALRGLNQKVRGQVQRDLPSPVVVVGATGGEAEPTPSLIHPWNVVSPSSSFRGRPSARRLPMGRRVEDEGRSECPAVTAGIGVESSGEITPRESGPTSLGSFVTRKPDQPLQGASK